MTSTIWQPATITVPAEIRIPTLGDCPKCGRHVVRRGDWARLKLETRKQIAKNFACVKARLMCGRCYLTAYNTGDHIDYDRVTLDGATFVDEYKHLLESGVTEHEIRNVLKMSEHAFTKALERAKTRGDL